MIRTATILLATLLVALTAPAAQAAPAARDCGNWHTHATVPGAAILRADRLRTQGGASCRTSRRIVRAFLRAKATNFECAAYASNPGTACIISVPSIRGRFACGTAGRRMYCMDEGFGVTFRERDESIG